MAQLGGAALVAVLTTVPVLLFSPEVEQRLLPFVLAVIIGVAGYMVERVTDYVVAFGGLRRRHADDRDPRLRSSRSSSPRIDRRARSAGGDPSVARADTLCSLLSQRTKNMATPAKLTPLQESEARRLAEIAARTNKAAKSYSDEEKAARKERVAKAKDALSRSVGSEGCAGRAGPCRAQAVPAAPERAEAARRRPLRDAHRGALQGAAEEAHRRPTFLIADRAVSPSAGPVSRSTIANDRFLARGIGEVNMSVISQRRADQASIDRSVADALGPGLDRPARRTAPGDRVLGRVDDRSNATARAGCGSTRSTRCAGSSGRPTNWVSPGRSSPVTSMSTAPCPKCSARCR